MKTQFDGYSDAPDFVVSRSSYFDQDTGHSLAWTETFPDNPRDHEDHSICGCTRQVGERPVGKPGSQQNRISIVEKGTEHAFFPYNNFVFDNYAEAPHGYFHFNKDDSVTIEAVWTEFSWKHEERVKEDEPVFLGVYQGNKVDISRFFNGHSPSQVVDLSTIQPGQIWMHTNNGWTGNGWTGERFSFVEDPKEAEVWRQAISLGSFLREATAPLKEDFETPVQTLYEVLRADRAILSAYKSLRELLEPLYRNFRTSEVCRKYRAFERVR